MNLLFINTIGKKKFGGGEKWTVAAAAGLQEKGFDVVVAGHGGSKLLEKAAAAGVETTAFNIYSDISPYYVLKLAHYLRKHRVDVVIVRPTDLTVTGLAVHLLKQCRRPRVLVRHGLPLNHNIRKHVWLHNTFANGIITNTQSISDQYASRHFFKEGFVTVIHNGVHIPAMEENGVHDFSVRFPEKKIVLSVGRLAHQKGYRYLIDAITLLPKETAALQFVVLGDGKYRQKLTAYAQKQGVADRIHFEGFVNDVWPYLRGCDLFVLPSLYEGMPNAAIEAMAAAKPVVLTRVNGADELIPDSSKGVLVPPQDPYAIARAISSLANNPEACRQIGNNARQWVTEHFTLEKMAEEMAKAV